MISEKNGTWYISHGADDPRLKIEQGGTHEPGYQAPEAKTFGALGAELPKAGRRAQATNDCVADEADELSFSAYDVIEVLEEADDGGWGRGRLQGRIGFFPGNYVAVRR